MTTKTAAELKAEYDALAAETSALAKDSPKVLAAIKERVKAAYGEHLSRVEELKKRKGVAFQAWKAQQAIEDKAAAEEAAKAEAEKAAAAAGADAKKRADADAAKAAEKARIADSVGLRPTGETAQPENTALESGATPEPTSEPASDADDVAGFGDPEPVADAEADAAPAPDAPAADTQTSPEWSGRRRGGRR
jgi:colicin import membrane protein